VSVIVEARFALIVYNLDGSDTSCSRVRASGPCAGWC